jgi:dihydrofolate reductase
MSNLKIAAIVAMDEARIIGRDGALPWHLPEDLAHFRKLTSGQVVVMGRKTWDSLPQKFKPLPGRTNVVVSRNPESLQLPAGVLVAPSPQQAIEAARTASNEGGTVWVIGGAELYRMMLPLCSEVYMTRVDGVHEGDARLPSFESDFMVTEERRGERCTFVTLVRREAVVAPPVE